MNRPDYSEREFNTDNPYTRFKYYINNVHPDRVRDTRQEILADVDSGYKGYRHAAALTEFVHTTVDFQSNWGTWRPDFLLEHDLSGNCEDQSILLASLLTSAGFDARYVVMEHLDEEGGHMATQVRFKDCSRDRLLDEARAFYDVDYDWLARESAGNDGVWLHCEVTDAGIVGVGPTDYFDVRSDGQMQWHNGVARDYLGVFEFY